MAAATRTPEQQARRAALELLADVAREYMNITHSEPWGDPDEVENEAAGIRDALRTLGLDR